MKAVRELEEFPEEPRVYGSSYTLHDGDAVKIGLNIVRPGGVHPPGKHENGDEFFFVQEGSGTVILDGTRHPVGPGSFIYIPKNTTHSVENAGDVPLRYLYVISYLSVAVI